MITSRPPTVVNIVPAQKIARWLIRLTISQTQPCPEIGAEVASIWGDVDCDGDVDSVDALKILRHVTALPVTQNEPCPDIGTRERG